jgi:hypothetical protein
MRRASASAALAVILLAPAAARAQFVSAGDKLSEPAAQNVEDTKLIGRLYATFGYYGESESSGDGMNASPDTLFWGDLRARLEADHISGGSFDFLGDFRLRFTPDEYTVPPVGTTTTPVTTSRGWIGGKEYDLRELFARYGGESASFSVGRMILRDLDAMTVDGASFAGRTSPSFEYGLAAGLFPNPYSRSLTTDYKFAADDSRSVTGYPAAVGAWGGYRYAQFYGSVGAGAIFPRNTSPGFKEDNRIFVTAHGYARVSPTVNFFHYGVVDAAGAAGAQLTNLQLGADWMATTPLRIELAYSHMSTYAIETYFRNYLEVVTDPAIVTNNLDVARMAADEGRLGANYDFGAGLDMFGQLRYRRRDAIETSQLNPIVASLPAEAQVDVSAGVRKKNAVAGWELGGNAAYITGDRTTALYVTVHGTHSYLEDRMDLDLDLGYVNYKDAVTQLAVDPTGMMPPVQTGGQASGSTLRAGGQVVFRQTDHWMYLADLHLGYNTSSTAALAPRDSTILETIGLFRVQYSF